MNQMGYWEVVWLSFLGLFLDKNNFFDIQEVFDYDQDGMEKNFGWNSRLKI